MHEDPISTCATGLQTASGCHFAGRWHRLISAERNPAQTAAPTARDWNENGQRVKRTKRKHYELIMDKRTPMHAKRELMRRFQREVQLVRSVNIPAAVRLLTRLGLWPK